MVRPYPVRGGHTVLVQTLIKYADYQHLKIAVAEYELVGPVVRYEFATEAVRVSHRPGDPHTIDAAAETAAPTRMTAVSTSR